MKFLSISAGDKIVIEITGNPSVHEVIESQVFDHEYQFFLDHIAYDFYKLISFSYNEDDTCQFIEFYDMASNLRRFYFQEPGFYRVYTKDQTGNWVLTNVVNESELAIKFDYRDQPVKIESCSQDLFEIHNAMWKQ